MSRSRTGIKALFLSVHLLLAGALLAGTPAARAADIDAAPEALNLRLNILNQYFEIVNSFHAIADDPEKTAVFALQQLEENYKQQGKPEEIVKMYQRLLKEARHQTLRNVAYMKLGEIYKRAGRSKEAISLLQQAMEENVKALK